jgi:hypothetical protein
VTLTIAILAFVGAIVANFRIYFANERIHRKASFFEIQNLREYFSTQQEVDDKRFQALEDAIKTWGWGKAHHNAYERLKALEDTVNGRKPFPLDLLDPPPGLKDRVHAITDHLGLRFTKNHGQEPRWEATKIQKAKK